MTIAYCRQWNELTGAPMGPMSEADARVRHDNGALYTAIVDEPGQPRRLVEVRLEVDYVSARKLGPHGWDVEPNWEDDWGFGNYERLLDFRRPIGYVPGERLEP